MASFCNICNEELFGDNFKPDYDIEDLINKLEPGKYYDGMLCEGCGLVAIGKDSKGVIMALYYKEGDWVEYKREGTNRIPNKQELE